MPVHTVTCPECESTLKSNKPIAPGKKIKCPECGTQFTTPEDKPEPAPVPKKPAAPPKKKPGPAAPAARKSIYDDPDDDGPETYAVIKEPEPVEEEEDEDEDEDDDEDLDDEEREERKKKKSKKPDLTYALDLSVRDPRGPVLSKVIKPTNLLMLWSTILIILGVVNVAWWTWPFMFAEHVLTDEEAHLAVGHKPPGEGQAWPEFKWEDAKGPDLAKLDDATAASVTLRLIIAGPSVFLIIMNALIIVGGVKMQQLESYAWGMTASILAILFAGVIGLALGIWCIVVLRDPKVILAFEHEQEERKKTY
jgi:hypothetical protein